MTDREKQLLKEVNELTRNFKYNIKEESKSFDDKRVRLVILKE